MLDTALAARQVHTLAITDFLQSFWPGDFEPVECNCSENFDIHFCTNDPREYRWEVTLSSAREDEQYPIILAELNAHGLKYPLGAKWYQGELVLCDGHHRVAALLDLGIKQVTVYVGAEEDSVAEMVAYDSRSWYSGTPDTPFKPLEQL